MSCEKCGSIVPPRIEWVDEGYSKTCVICGKVKYFFPASVADKSIFHRDRKKYDQKLGEKKFFCLCHTILGGKPCRKLFRARARNAKYAPGHAEKVKAFLIKKNQKEKRYKKKRNSA